MPIDTSTSIIEVPAAADGTGPRRCRSTPSACGRTVAGHPGVATGTDANPPLCRVGLRRACDELKRHESTQAQQTAGPGESKLRRSGRTGFQHGVQCLNRCLDAKHLIALHPDSSIGGRIKVMKMIQPLTQCVPPAPASVPQTGLAASGASLQHITTPPPRRIDSLRA